LERRLPEAKQAIENAALFAVAHREGQHALANAHLQMGEPQRAVDILQGLAAQDPRDGETRRLLARALAASGQLEPAARALAEAGALASDDPELAFLVATEFLWMKKPDRAEALFAQVLAARPIPQTRVLIGRAYRDAGEYDRARAMLQAALAADPKVRRAHYYLGMVILADARTGPGRLEQAIEQFRAELKLAPDDPPANDQLGVALLDAERAAEALPALEAAVRGQPRALYLLHLARAQLALDRPAESAAAARRALELAQDHGEGDAEAGKIHYQLGLALRKLGAAEEAAQHLAEARRLAGNENAGDSRDDRSPLGEIPLLQRQALKRRVLADLTRAFFNLGVIQAQGPRPAPAPERFTRAAAFFERAAALDPEFPQLQSSLGVAYFNARMFDKATAPLSRAVAASPSDANLKRLLATSWLNTEAWDKAAALLQDDPERTANASLQFAYGLALLKSGRAREAEPVLAGLLAAQGDSEELRVLVAQAREQAAAPRPSPSPAAAVLFRDIRAEAGITFFHHAAPEKKYIVESMSGGVALFDYDNDGRVDIYFVDSLTVDTANDPRSARSALYRNLGGGKFQDVTDKAKVAHPGWGVGVCTADADGDGWNDVYVTGVGRNTLYRNNRDGTFTDVAEKAGVTGGGWSAGCGFADYDRDGDLDLFVSRYVKIDLANLPEFGKGKTCEYRGVPVQCGPRGLPGDGDFLFRNEGDGTFTEVGQKAGVSDPRAHFGLGIAWFDQNADGWPDLYVANDSTPSFLYVNQKDGTFKESAFPMGVAVSQDGGEQGSMGVTLGDYDRSGKTSIFVTNFAEEYNALYRNEGTHFTDMSFRSKTAAVSLPFVGWGTSFFDYDNDGWLDLIVANGHVYPQMDQAQRAGSAGYRQRRLLYHNRGDGTFDEVAARYGPVLTEERVSRGLAVGDLDDDGRLDVVINDLDGAPQVLRNEIAERGHWLLVRLVGKGKNTNAIGAVVTVTSGGVSQARLVQSGTSYISQDDMRRHFGLGTRTLAESVEVRWPDGTATTLSNVKADQVLEIRQPR
jgi:tetratricopeptide (TPR) repeat protein